MMDLHKLLTETGIRQAVVIDDAFDEIPQPNDIYDEEWSIFFDDLTDGDFEQLSDIYPEFESTNVFTLQKSKEFVRVLWKHRSTLSMPACTTLFQRYEDSNKIEKDRAREIVQALEKAGLTCTEAGRDFDSKASEADLIVIDLFLGPQESHDIDPDIERVHKLVAHRADNPPIIILTSSNRRLGGKRNDFRDKAGLLASTFRAASKSELIEEGRLELILSRLAAPYKDAKKVAAFLDALDKGLKRTQENFLVHLRRLDLPDLAQIKTLLLNFEGEPLGSYLLDVADRVLQHEIECDCKTIDAVLSLNQIDLSKYPAPHLVGTSDLQDLVHRMIFMNKARLDLFANDGMPRLQFGDVLRRKQKCEEDYGDEVCLVVTPACDLVRNEAKHIMLLPGKLQELEPKNWSYKDSPVRTPILILPDGQRKSIKWTLDAAEMQPLDDLNELLGQGKNLVRIARLRELHALALQQKLLARMGRIGQPANLPAPFPVTVSVFYVDTNQKACKLDIDEIESAVCYVGRGIDPEPILHLVLTEQTCDQFKSAFMRLPEREVHRLARDGLKIVREDLKFITELGEGKVILPAENGTRYIKSEDDKIYAAITRNTGLEHGEHIREKNTKKAAIIVKVSEVVDDGSNQGGFPLADIAGDR